MKHIAHINEFLHAPVAPQSVEGTAFQGISITSTVNKLKRILGTPKKGDNSNFDFSGTTPDGEVFTVYDWNNLDTDVNAPIKFNIGAHSKMIAMKAKDYLLKRKA
jgi:hypothetical protein